MWIDLKFEHASIPLLYSAELYSAELFADYNNDTTEQVQGQGELHIDFRVYVTVELVELTTSSGGCPSYAASS